MPMNCTVIWVSSQRMISLWRTDALVHPMDAACAMAEGEPDAVRVTIGCCIPSWQRSSLSTYPKHIGLPGGRIGFFQYHYNSFALW